MIPLLAALALAQPVVLDDGHAVLAVRAVQPFALQVPYTYDWTAERPRVDHGTLLVLDVQPAWIVPSDTHQAVLYLGDTPVERVVTDVARGRVVVLAPGDLDVGALPLYFGGEELPERVDRGWGERTLALARARGFGPLAPPARAAPVVYADHREAVAAARRLAATTP